MAGERILVADDEEMIRDLCAHILAEDMCDRIRQARGLHEVALSGGVWQNVTLLQKTLDHLRAAKFTVHVHHLVPPNDGGLALGQAVIAACAE